MEVDWDALRRAATAVMRRAYVPYSGFPVGAAGLVDDGRIVTGCNVENASYGLTLCAECGMVSALHASGGGRLVAVSCVGRDEAPLASCGRCRQLLAEHGGPDCLVETANGPRSLADLLPDAFGATHLAPPATGAPTSAGSATPTDDSASAGSATPTDDPASAGSATPTDGADGVPGGPATGPGRERG